MTPSERAFEDMPDIVGCPGDGGAYQRSLEKLLVWYDTHYKTIRQCLEGKSLTEEELVDLVDSYAWDKSISSVLNTIRALNASGIIRLKYERLR